MKQALQLMRSLNQELPLDLARLDQDYKNYIEVLQEQIRRETPRGDPGVHAEQIITVICAPEDMRLIKTAARELLDGVLWKVVAGALRP